MLVIFVEEVSTADICTGLVTVAPAAGLQMVTDGAPAVGEHEPPPPLELVMVTTAVSLLVVSATLVATTL